MSFCVTLCMEELFAAVKYADTELHNRIKKEADKKFGPKGGYAKNLWVLKEYKKRGGKSSYKGQKPSNDKIKNLIKGSYLELDIMDSFFELIDDLELSDAKRAGPKSAAQTPSKPSERKKGSDKNPAGSAGTKSGKAIEFSAKVIEGLKNKVKEHNSKHSKKVSLSQLKKVYRRGAGAFSSSHRPGMSRGGWAMARVNTFLRMMSGKPVKDAYRKADSDIATASTLDMTNNWHPSDEDILQAEADVKTYDLQYDFDDEDESIIDNLLSCD